MAVLVVFCLEKGIVERDSLDTLHIAILQELRVNVEKHGHIDRLPLRKSLLLEAETLDL